MRVIKSIAVTLLFVLALLYLILSLGVNIISHSTYDFDCEEVCFDQGYPHGVARKQNFWVWTSPIVCKCFEKHPKKPEPVVSKASFMLKHIENLKARDAQEGADD